MRWGRHAAIYVNDVRITRVKDIETSDEAEDHKLTPRAVPYANHLPGGKDCSVAFTMLDDEGASYSLLQSAYDEFDQDLDVVLVKDRREATSPALQFLGCCLQFGTNHPESGPAATRVVLAPTGLTEADGPQRITYTIPE